jgi:phosphogluconate dehydratase
VLFRSDRIRLDAVQGQLDVLVDEAEWLAREPVALAASHAVENAHGLGRDLFGGMRKNVSTAEQGAVTWL